MKKIYLSFGTNIGSREQNMVRVLEQLEQKGIHILQKSSIYETEPIGVTDQAWFLNMVIEVETKLRPEELLEIIKEIEKAMGREKTYKWGPRIMDIDILLFDDEVIEMEKLQIPHKFMHKRKFVLIPLAEIASNRQHPLYKKSIQELLNECDDASIVRPLKT